MRQADKQKRSLALLLVLWVCAAVTASALEAAAPQPERPRINVKDFGAKGDCQRVPDGMMSKGSAVLTSASAHFTAQDVGQPIYVLGASVQAFPELGEVAGAPLNSRIVAVTNPHTVTLADAAKTEAHDVSVAWGTDDSDAIKKAIGSLKTTGGTVFFPAGTYRVTYQGGPGVVVDVSNVRLQGVGNESAIFNSSVIFHAKMKDGILRTEQAGVPVLYVGRSKDAPCENVEIDHFWLGDNGQNYDYAIWGPHGPAVIGSAGRIDHFSFHDLTVATGFLCGVGTDSETDGFSIHHVNVLSTGEHGFYLAGAGDHGDVHDNRIIGTAARPMRMGIAVKKKQHLRITHNEVANVEFQAISVVGDSPLHHSSHVLIADNWIHDLAAWHTDAITIFNADDVVIRHNRIADTSWIGINLRTGLYTVFNVLIQDNVITRAAGRNPAYAIAVHYDPPPNQPKNAPWPGSIRDITIDGNIISDCPDGILVTNTGGKNVVRGNRVENREMQRSATGYKVALMPGAVLDFSGNVGLNCGEYHVTPESMGQGNELK
jgi:parallel beta-helix repeat protein